MVPWTLSLISHSLLSLICLLYTEWSWVPRPCMEGGHRTCEWKYRTLIFYCVMYQKQRGPNWVRRGKWIKDTERMKIAWGMGQKKTKLDTEGKITHRKKERKENHIKLFSFSLKFWREQTCVHFGPQRLILLKIIELWTPDWSRSRSPIYLHTQPTTFHHSPSCSLFYISLHQACCPP